MSNIPIVFTNHARARLKERELSESWVFQTIQSPTQRRGGKNRGSHEFVRRFGSNTVTVVATQNTSHEWVVISAWIDPPVPGTNDWKKKQRYRTYRRAGFWQKVRMLLAKYLFGRDF